MKSKDPYRQKLQNAWNRFTESGKVDFPFVRNEIADSWKRCSSYGIDPNMRRLPLSSASTNLSKRERFAKKENLIQVSIPFLESLYQLVRSLEMVIVLTDEAGFILEAIGEGKIWEHINQSGEIRGMSAQEKIVGTSALNLSLRKGSPVQVVAEEHYCSLFHSVTTSCAPIYDVNEQITGGISVTAFYEVGLRHPHTLGMVAAVIDRPNRATDDRPNGATKKRSFRASERVIF